MQTVTISSKYQIVIPSSVRAKLGVGSGDKLVIDRLSDGELVLKKEPSYRDLIGTIKPPQNQEADAVKRIRKLRDDWK